MPSSPLKLVSLVVVVPRKARPDEYTMILPVSVCHAQCHEHVSRYRSREDHAE